MLDAKIIIKSIDKHIRKRRIFQGGRSFGVDYITWRVSYPHLCAMFDKAGEVVMGRPGRYIPLALVR